MLTKEVAYRIAETLRPCPFCGATLDVSIRGSGAYAMNPKARCVTEDCCAGSLPVISLDVPEQVAAWNRRAADDSIEWLEKGNAEWRSEALFSASLLTTARAQANVAIAHLHKLLNHQRTATQMMEVERAAREWLDSIGSEAP